MAKRFVVVYKDSFLVDIPSWNGGKWTTVKEEATKFIGQDSLDFFTKFYPDFEIVEVEVK